MILLGSLTFVLGCQPFHLNKNRLEPAPEVFQATPGQQDLIQLVNQRSQSVRELQAQVSVSLTGIPTRLNGSLTVQRPKNLRLKISPMGVDSLGADVGSNSDEFWLWVKSAGVGAESVMMHARHDEFAYSPNANHLPLDPKWLFDSLGLVQFDAASPALHGPTPRDGRLVVQQTEQRPTGPQTAVMIFDARTGVLNQKSVYDAQSRLVGYCDMTHHQYFPSLGVAIPTKIKITFRPGTNLESVAQIQLSNIQLNGLYIDQASAWQMPNPMGVRRIDLAKTKLATHPLVQTARFEEPSPPTSNYSDYLPFRGALLNQLPSK